MDVCVRRLKNVRQMNFPNEPTTEEKEVALVPL